MTYSEYVGRVRETNRPSGGIKTISTVCSNTFLTPASKVLEIGSNTGFTSINIARLSGASVIGIDPVESSVLAANEKAKSEKLKNTSFIKGSALSLPFSDDSFDMVWLSNVLSFIENKGEALKECFRVLKPNGFLVFVPIYYVQNPPQDLVKEIEKAIAASLHIRSKSEWIEFIHKMNIPHQVTFEKDYVYSNVSDKIQGYVEEVMNKEFLRKLPDKEYGDLKAEGLRFMELFNKNLTYCNYTIFIVQKLQSFEETELFSSYEV